MFKISSSIVCEFPLVILLVVLNSQHLNGQGVEVLPIRPKHIFDTRDQVTTLLNKPYSPATYASMSSYIYQLYGEEAVIDIESEQACRLNSNQCHSNSQCCSKFCRCVRWNSSGKEVCWRRCL